MSYELFTSYRREDRTRATEIETALRLRGVSSWRDVRNIPHGSETVGQITRAITEETNGFLSLVSATYLKRREGRPDVVWEIELPQAAQRWARSGYPLTPLFAETDPADLTARCAEEGIADLAHANGMRLRSAASAEDDRVIARAQLANALHHSPADLAVTFRSFPMAPPGDARLDVDWTGQVDGAAEADWDQTLFPALEDLRDALLAAGVTHLRVHVLARLNALLALGMHLPLATKVEMTVIGRGAEPWPRPDETRTVRPLLEQCVPTPEGGSARVGVVELSLIADLARDAAAVAMHTRAGHHVRIASASADRTFEARVVARAAAEQIGDAVRALRDGGVTEFHVLLASSAPMAVLIGRQLHALGRVHAYFSNRDRVITRAYAARV